MIRKSFDLMLLIGVPAGLGLIVVSHSLVVLLFGQSFAPSSPVLAIMGIVLICMYQNILLGRFLVSIDRQNIWTLIMVVAMVITVLLDLMLVPWCQQKFGNGALGGALSYAVTELGMTITGIALLPTGSLSRANLWTGLRIGLAGMVMFGASWWCRELFIAVPILIGAVVYFGMIALLRVIPNEDVALLRDFARRALASRRRGMVAPAIVEGE
jgi:O-antigen/teichoic acid export membrane protein